MNILEVNNLTIGINQNGCQFEAIRDLSFGIAKAEVAGIVGQSGAGKTLTALSIMRLLRKEAFIKKGQILYKGADLATEDMAKIRGSQIGLVYQNPFTSLNPAYKISSQLLECTGSVKEAKELLELVGLKSERIFDSYPHELSGGQCQRVCIAMAIAKQPQLLIADEPTTGLDVTIAAKIMELLVGIAKDKKISLILIGHDLGIMAKYCHRLMVFYHGSLVEEGSVNDILDKPKHSYTRKMIDCLKKPKSHYHPPTNHQLPALLEFKQVVKKFPTRRRLFRHHTLEAVDNVSFKLNEQETVGLVGESGCGKSTLANLSLGLLKPTSGDILFQGQNINGLSKEAKKQRQIIFQDPYSSLNPRMKIKKIIEEPLCIYKVGDKQARTKRVNELLELVGIAQKDAEKYPHQFSTGQQQRITIARALALNPKLVVLDEPTSSLDTSIKAQIINLLKELGERFKMSYLYISHDLAMMPLIADRIIVLYQGRIVEQGSAKDIFKNPKHSYTQLLIDSVPML
ncbi:MAG: ABC transporter ATP-binding protein [Actinobacteria bacterium]|nr:MAG: ABC transporter ATP-binding protein [Actinomycetota bacterium]